MFNHNTSIGPKTQKFLTFMNRGNHPSDEMILKFKKLEDVADELDNAWNFDYKLNRPAEDYPLNKILAALGLAFETVFNWMREAQVVETDNFFNFVTLSLDALEETFSRGKNEYPNIFIYQGQEGNTLLHITAKEKFYAAAAILTCYAGADVYEENANGKTPLDIGGFDFNNIIEQVTLEMGRDLSKEKPELVRNWRDGSCTFSYSLK